MSVHESVCCVFLSVIMNEHKTVYMHVYILVRGMNNFDWLNVIVISRYEHDIQVIAQDRGGNKLNIMRMNRDITNFYPTGNNRFY